MLRLLTFVQSRTAQREEGVVAAEYVVLAAALIVAVTAAIVAFGSKLTAAFNALNLT